VENDTAARHRSIYRGKIVEFVLETVELPNGASAQLEIVRHPGGAAAVALDERDQVCLLRQYRHAAGGWLWELPAGKLEPDEPPFCTARRELAEEAGLEADNWADLGALNSSPGVLTEVIYLYLATGLKRVPREHDAHEVIEIHWLPFGQALEWCLDGTISDAKTLIGLFRAEALRAKK
jgi:ADP-ribose pyrophosphatase